MLCTGPTTFEGMEPITKLSCVRILITGVTQTGAASGSPGGLQIHKLLPIICISNDFLGGHCSSEPTTLMRPETFLIASAGEI